MTDKKLRIKVKTIPTTISMDSKSRKWSGDAIVHINGKGVELFSDIDEQLDEFTNMVNNNTFISGVGIDEYLLDFVGQLSGEMDCQLREISEYSAKLWENDDLDNISSLLDMFVDLERKYHEYQALKTLEKWE